MRMGIVGELLAGVSPSAEEIRLDSRLPIRFVQISLGPELTARLDRLKEGSKEHISD
jgi:hypothetical protein